MPIRYLLFRFMGKTCCYREAVHKAEPQFPDIFPLFLNQPRANPQPLVAELVGGVIYDVPEKMPHVLLTMLFPLSRLHQ